MSARKGILFAVPGTTCPGAKVAFDRITSAAAHRFPGVELRWAYTSAPVRRKLAAQGLEAKCPEEALLAMREDGLAQVAVVSLHLTDGMEFGELADTVSAFSCQPENRMKVVMGRALMASEADWLRALAAILTGLPAQPGAQGRVILVAHGSTDPRAEKTLQAAAQSCRKVDSRLRLGMILGMPDRDAVVRECQADGVRKVWLVPCMVVAGFTAREDIAGEGEKSWATSLTRAGIEVIPVIRGLGELDGVVEIWLDQADELLKKADAISP
jgi:sirohydrochlorin cobaltochelatase